MNRKDDTIRLVFIVLIVIFINIIGQYYYKYYDFTDDKRYTLTEPTRKLLSSQKDIVFVKVLLGGDLPSGFTRLKNSVEDLLNQFKSINPKIDFIFQNPMEGTTKEKNKVKEDLRKEGIVPVNLYIGDGDSKIQRSIYPYAILNFGSRVYVVNLLEAQVSGMPQEESLNNSVALLEYKFANAIQKLRMKRKGNIIFVGDKGGIDDVHINSLFKDLNKYYFVGKINLDSTYRIHKNIDLLIVARPTKKFTKKNQFIIDQYLMNGGNIIWLVDKVDGSLDSINTYGMYTPKMIETGLDDLFFKYGIRIKPDLVQDLQCTRIPQKIGMSGGKPQIEQFPWYYHLLVNSNSTHPISSGISDIWMPFVSTIDTIETSSDIKKTVLLTSSRTSRYQLYPMRLTFQIMKYKPQVNNYNKPFLPISVLAEGKFESFFKNKLTSETKQMLEKIGEEFVEESVKKGKMIFVGDGEFVMNLFNTKTNKPTAIGYNKWENFTFQGNRDFILNAVEYMMDDEGIVAARSKRVKLRLLDKGRLIKEKSKWRIINIVFPLLLLAFFGIAFTFYRRKRYS